MSAEKPDSDFEKWCKETPATLENIPPLFLQSTWPQYRKRVTVNGVEEETHLDGTETADTVILKYDHTDEYKNWRDEVLRTATNGNP